MGGIILLAVLVGSVIWWLARRQSVDRNERSYLRSRGYSDDKNVPSASISPESRMMDLLASLDDVTPYSRERAAEELSLMCDAGFRDERMFAPLATALEDPNAAVRSAVALALGKLGDIRAIAALKRTAENDDSGHARNQARLALERLEPLVTADKENRAGD
ncbi:MAG TPA: HEAT repeat domain-containing protein [Blastocatellia bacterium]|nr:HEAT repeat domain-containing protein [Blastocatellia bacterium]